MALPRISAKAAAAIDEELMGAGGFSIDQLMELAGQAVAHAAWRVLPEQANKAPAVLVLAGPGNNGGDGLVAARHLALLGAHPTLYMPKQKQADLFSRLETQLEQLAVPKIDTPQLADAFAKADLVVDALFGFSFKPPVREAFVPAMDLLAGSRAPVLAVDVPSGWDVDAGPGTGDDRSQYNPAALISLTAPKKAADFFEGRHFIGGRFVSPEFAAKHGFRVPPYKGVEQVWEEPRRG